MKEEFLLFKNSVSFAVFGPKRKVEAINSTNLKLQIIVAPVFRRMTYLVYLSSTSITELQMPHFEAYKGGSIEFLHSKNSVFFPVFGPKKEDWSHQFHISKLQTLVAPAFRKMTYQIYHNSAIIRELQISKFIKKEIKISTFQKFCLFCFI